MKTPTGASEEKCTVGVFMMQKNEEQLLPAFIHYYGKLFGYSALHIFDNGSSQETKHILENAQELGASVFWDFDRPKHFEKKGQILSEAIDANQDKFSVFLPLDCDEFIGICPEEGQYSCDPTEINDYFGSLGPGVYKTCLRLRNHPTVLNNFAKNRGAAKIFFSKCKAKAMDVGLHTSQNKQRAKTSRVCHFEFHNKPFEVFVEHARNKMQLRVDVDDLVALSHYRRRGVHLVPFLLPGGRTAYERSFENVDWIETSALQDAFSCFDIAKPF